MTKKTVTYDKKPVAKKVTSKTTVEKSLASAAKKADSLGYFARTYSSF